MESTQDSIGVKGESVGRHDLERGGCEVERAGLNSGDEVFLSYTLAVEQAPGTKKIPA
jgi:hypothetical protein